MSIQHATIVKIMPRMVWIESDIWGSRHVVIQHEGCEAFTYATFHYDYRYTDNAGTLRAAEGLALRLGAVEPVEHRQRAFDLPIPTQDEIRERIKLLQDQLEDGEEPK